MNDTRQASMPARIALSFLALISTAAAAVVNAGFDAATTVPITAASYTATGNTVNFTLAFTPPVGTNLTVVNNTGLAFIQGGFDNLTQGQAVNLTYGGVTYPFVANYFGGSGNDLVLQWGNTRLVGWGYNSYGGLGIGTTTTVSAPAPVYLSGPTTGKGVASVAVGGGHSFVACWDGTLAGAGYNSYGQLGTGNTNYTNTAPVAVTQSAFAGRTLAAVAGGANHSVALLADGSLYAWGWGYIGQLGTGSTSNYQVPTAVVRAGTLFGKVVTSLAVGGNHNLILCSDGTLAAWGDNSYGQLGNNSTTISSFPIAVDRTGVLAGKTVIAIAAGNQHSLALCSDGTLAAWGNNSAGQLGDNSTTQRNVPVAVDRSGVLSGKTITALAGGYQHSLALCSDGTLAAWGSNASGQLGDTTTTNRSMPVAVIRSGVLSGKMIVTLAAGDSHSLALCSDGTVATWGRNTYAELGNGTTTNSNVPVAVTLTGLQTGERICKAMTGPAGTNTFGLVAMPPPPLATSLAATGILDTRGTLNGSVNAQGTTTAVSFEYGLTPAYGTTIAAAPASLTGAITTAVSVSLSELLPGSTYHFRVVATGVGGTVKGADMTFTTSSFASLAGLSVSNGPLVPAFDTNVSSYSITVPFAVASLTLTPTMADPGATVTINGVPANTGAASGPVALSVGDNPIDIKVTASGGLITHIYSVMAVRLPEVFTFSSATDIPLSVGNFAAAGNSATIALNYAPVPGTSLMLVRNTGSNAIQGAFSNLVHGQSVNLTYGGISYTFVVNYIGGTGNDLVLEWANIRLLAWGIASQLGSNSSTNSSVPVAVDMSGVLFGKTVLSIAASQSGTHNLALCADGTLATWGSNLYGQLGNNSTTLSKVPVMVDATGVLAGKSVIAVSVGEMYCLALCSDGTLAAWGYNTYGQLGNNSNTNSSVPVLVNRSGVLAGKTVTAIASGLGHNLALCSDGTLVAWGANSSGQLGNNSSTNSSVPVLVNQTGVLAGKTIRILAGGENHSLALCADGTLATWGYNNYGQLGNNSTTNSSVPLLVDRSGVLTGKTIHTATAGGAYCLALCTDGTFAAWGYNNSGQLGNNSTTNSSVPVAVIKSGVLSGKSVSGISAGSLHNLAQCADGTLAAWGSNAYGQLGNNSTTNSSVPVLVITSGLAAGERVMTVAGGSSHSLARVASLPAPIATTLALTTITDTGATLKGNVNANGSSTAVSFQYGPTTAYGSTLAATPASLTGTAATAVSATLGGLLAGTTYHYRVVATSAGGTVTGEDLTFTTSTYATLTSLTLGNGTMEPAFASNTSSYIATVPYAAATITVTPVTANPSSTVKINGTTVTSGSSSNPLALIVGDTVISTVVTAADGLNTMTYSVKVTRLPQSLTFNSPVSLPVTVGNFIATGVSANIALNYAPPPGTHLMVVKNTGVNPIRGTFDNLSNGQMVSLTYGGISYAFVANYYGGTGNDLVLQWANMRLLAWGSNSNGELGNNSTTNSSVAVPVVMSGVLAGKSVIRLAEGDSHSLVLCSDGTLAGWGYDVIGQLGNGAAASTKVPVLVNQSGVLAGKTITAIASGSNHGLALCSDGNLAAWGSNTYGQLGNGGIGVSTSPVLVTRTGVLAGKTISAIAGGGNHSLALCMDGTLATWGWNAWGQLGIGSTTDSKVPVAVDLTGVLAGKTITAVAAGASDSLVLCSDGTLAAWGNNTWGQLGNNSSTYSNVPVLVVKTGVLVGKTVTAIASGAQHCLALCSDGTLVAWGYNNNGQLGNNSTGSSSVPVLVTQTGILAGKTIQAIAAGTSHSHALCTDGTLAAWGYDNSGQLGNNSSTQSSVPVWVTTTMLGTGERFTAIAAGVSQSIALVASPSVPLATTVAATPILDAGATLKASVNAQGNTTTVSFEYGLTAAYGTTLAATPASASGSSATAASATVSGLLSGTTYHYRVVATNPGGTARGDDMTFTTTTLADLSSLTLGTTTLYPAFAGINKNYSATVSNATSAITVTPVCANLSSGIKVNGITVASGATSGSISLAVGNNVITTVVTSAGGANVTSYVVTICRLPTTFAFNAATDVPVTANDCLPAGNIATFALNYAPIPGTHLMVVKNTGTNPIQGTFDNLAQGQSVTLTYNGVAYSFVANYSGGTGNDLVLQWKNTRLLAWGGGYTYYGQLGNGSSASSPLPVPVDMSGVLAGKTVIAIATGPSHSLALCADGTLATWGYNYYGQLGNKSTNNSSVPVLVDRTGVLAGKTVVRIAAGNNNCLVVCSDGTLAAWGDNWSGALGDNSTTSSSVPVLVDMSGVLAGKSVSAIAAGNHTCLALCADGNIATWGWNDYGQLGNNNIISSSVPVLVDRTGVLAGKTVATIASENTHNLALCSDGTVAAWGYNNYGQLGNNSTSNSSVPVAVTQTGVLVSKTVVAIAAGDSHSLALCADGSLAAWGYNNYGQLGNNSSTNSSVPILVTQTGMLAGKTVVGAIAGDSHSIALCSDGTLAAWGYNVYGQLGNNSISNSSVPVTVSQSNLGVGERAMAFGAGAGQSVALFASPPPPVVATLSASAILDTSATLNGNVNAQGTATAVTFEYGLTTTYGSTVAASPSSLGSIITTPASAAITGLSSGTTYHYRIVATGGNTTRGDDMTFTTTTFAALSGLNLSDGILSPAFATSTTNYLATVPFAVQTLTLTPLVATPGATLTIDGLPVDPGAASSPLDLTIGETRIDIVVIAPGGSISQTYSVTVTRMPEFFAFNAATDVPLTVSGFAATGNTPAFALNYAPVPGTSLLVVQNTGNSVIQGSFDNLTRGQMVNLTYDGVIYPFVADYAGGTGNDLVLRWGNTKPLLWGDNAYGQLGIGSTVSSSVAVPLTTTGVLAGKRVIAMATGDASNHSFARCADGTLAGWGDGYSNVPGLGPQTGGLVGKTVAAVAVGMSHNLALCTDGTLAAWGDNRYGQLGNNTTSNSSVPVLVDRAGALAGKTVIAIAAGYWHCLVLCSDGTLATWGYNANSQLGTGTTADSKVPAAVIQSGVLAGKSVIAISSGSSHNLALCSDGTIAAWGYNSSGQLGNNSSTTSSAPVLVDRSGVLTGKTATAIAAGDTHSMVMCSDGFLATWGYNSYGQLGNNSTINSNVPVAVTQTGVLAGKTVTAITAGRSHNLALCADGTLAAWGYNASGQLGNNSLTNSSVPARVGTGGPGTGERFVTIGAGYGHSLAILAQPPPPVASTVAATAIDDAGATLNVGVSPNGSTTNESFEFGLTTSYGSTVTATPTSVSGSGTVPASAAIGGLLPGTEYHYRAIASSAYGTSKGEDMTFTTSSFSALADLVLSNGTLDPVFVRSRAGYLATVPFAAHNLVVTPIAADGTPTVTVNGVSVQVGTPSNPLPLSPGENVIRVAVTAEDGKMSRTYTVTVTRLPASFVFNSPSDVPVSVGDFTGGGNAASIALNFAPTPGTILTVVNSTGGLIRNPFSNLAHGQLLPLTYNGITYSFVANYYGGSGNDLVLQWANTRVLAWGSNAKGQLGNGTTTSSSVPVAIDASGILAAKSVIGLAAGMTGFSEYGHSLAFCADGTVAAWGTGSTLGNNSTTDSSVPVWVDRTGVLAGKTVAAVSVGSGFSLALCSDGTLAGWGYNSYGQLGNNSSTSTQVPVAVLMSGVLAGKTVVAVATGNSHALALCADGTLAAWGYNASGQLGNNSKVNSSVPVLVDQTGVLAGKNVVAISAGEASNLVLCSDGTLAAWGANGSGQLGNNTMTNSLTPVLVDRSGVLAGKTVVKIASGNWHNLALCSDGTLAAWGGNGWGALGDNNVGSSPVPVFVDQTGVLAGKTVVAISAARIGSLATCSDGTMATWGQNTYGQLGNNSKTDSNVPVQVNTSALGNGERFMLGISGSTSGDHTLALVASPLPTAVTQPAMILTHSDVSLNGSVNANGNATTVSFEYGLDATYGNSAAAIPAAVSGNSDTQVSLNLGGLLANTTYHFRVLATCNGGVVRGSDMTFIPSNLPVFAGYTISTPFQTPANVALKKLLAKASDPEGTVCSVTLAGPASANGGTAVLQASGILYTPPAGFTGTDTFLVTITDANGAATSGTVTATVGPAAAAGGATTNPPQITVLDGGQIRLKFHGIAGRSYQIQRSTDLATWATIATASADSIGAMTFTDATPPLPNAYYRLALP